MARERWPENEGRIERIRLALLLGLLAACFLMGGASRLDVVSLILLQPLAALCAVAFVLVPGPIDWHAVRVPLLLLGALAAIMVAQLIPLPPSIWSALPGHGQFAESANVAGLAQPWRPISLTPDLTLASLVGLVVPLAIFVGFASIRPHRRQLLLVAILIGAVGSALFALAQVSAGEQSPLYLYRITNAGNGVGLFSNRNHQALLLAMTWPMLAVWAMLPRADANRRVASRWIAVGFALFLLPLLLVTGSRAGLVLGVVGVACAAIIWRLRPRERSAAGKGFSRVVAIAAGFGAVIVIAATVMLSRAEAVQRMLTADADGDVRMEAAPLLIRIARDFLPVGSGFGSFDPLFRSYEPLDMLKPQYLNHAHNDLLELAITGGLPGLMLAVVFLAWFARQSVRAWRSPNSSVDVSLSQAASAMIGMVLLSSLVDYPLRSPLMMAIVAIACGWLGALGGGGGRFGLTANLKSALLAKRL